MRKRKAESSAAVFLLLLALASCKTPYDAYTGSNAAKIYFHKSAAVDSFVALSAEEAEDKAALSKISRANDFPLLVYESGCAACQTLKGYLRSLAADDHYLFYGISSINYARLHAKDEVSFPQVSSYPTVLFYIQGVPADTFTGAPSTYASFKKNMEYFASPASLWSLNGITSAQGSEEGSPYTYDLENPSSETLLEETLADKTQAEVLFSWARCSDCASLFDSYLLGFLDKNPSLSLFCFETDYFRRYKPESEPADQASEDYAYWKRWADFSSKYGFGVYKGGKVPSFAVYQGGSFREMEVYHNEGAAVSSEGLYSYPEAYAAAIQQIKSSSEEELRSQTAQAEAQRIEDLLAS
jgi:hypothetical protein